MNIYLILLFPIWALLLSTVAYFFPAFFASLKPMIIPLLGIIMFGMGISLSAKEFYNIWQKPKAILLGLILQFTIMPLAAWLVGSMLNLPLELLVGLILVGCCPGGTASNVICYLARGNIALSITLTTLATLTAIITTPLLTWLYLGEKISVPALDMLMSILKIIILPVGLGVITNYFLNKQLNIAKRIFPIISMAAIVLIIAIIVALNKTNLSTVGALVIISILLHNSIGLSCGYGISRLLGFDQTTARTIAIEVGMQNSGLGVALALKYFSTLAALPGAIFSIWHNVSGSLLAVYWSQKTIEKR